MWSKLWTWAGANKLLAGICAVIFLIALESVTAGIPARRAAAGYFQLIKQWAEAYKRDTAATKTAYEARIKVLTGERDAALRKYQAARGRMDAKWTPPAGAKELETRFRVLGYGGEIK